MIKPNLFVIGAPKSGTSSLCSYLEKHPDVVFSNPKEPNYFCSDITNDYSAARTEDAYLSRCFPKDYKRYAIVGDGSVSSLYSDFAVQRILQFNPNAKFIVMLRNPIELVYSFHLQLLNSDQENVEDFIEAWRLQDRRKCGDAIPDNCLMPKALQYGDVGKLGEQLERLYGQVSRSKVMVILFEDFREHTERTYRSVLTFLGLPVGPDIHYKVVNESRRRKWIGFQRLLTSLAKMKMQLNIQKSFGVLSYLSSKNFEPYKRPPLPRYFVYELSEYFKKDIVHLSELIEHDCTRWIQDD